MANKMKEVEIDLTKDEEIELASYHDVDIMRITCFATHEGVNGNNLQFRREVLANSFRTLVDKPVFIVPNQFNCPTGHGFNRKEQKFDQTKRKVIGHIVSAEQVVVDNDKNICFIDGLTLEEIPQGEYRIMVRLVIYKQYFRDISEQLEMLHNLKNLFFSMESKVVPKTLDNGITDCESIFFTGLAIVENPAFAHSTSIEISEEEDKEVDFEKLYNEQVEKVNDLTTEKEKVETSLASVNEELETAKTELEAAKEELASVKEELANTKGDLVNANAEKEELLVYKDKVELAEKVELAKVRASKLSKFKEVKEDEVDALAELTNEEFADKLIEYAEEYQGNVERMGVPFHNQSMASDKDKLMKLFK